MKKEGSTAATPLNPMNAGVTLPKASVNDGATRDTPPDLPRIPSPREA
jgi:hypothetical protein